MGSTPTPTRGTVCVEFVGSVCEDKGQVGQDWAGFQALSGRHLEGMALMTSGRMWSGGPTCSGG